MDARRFGPTGRQVSPIGFGTWAIGADWGSVDERDALAALNEALDRGVNFIDTADVYGDGRAEKLVATVRREFARRVNVSPRELASVLRLVESRLDVTMRRLLDPES